MRLQEHFYLISVYDILEHLEATQETATKLRYYQRRIRDLPAVRARGLQAGIGNETFGDECTSVFQLVHAMKSRTKRMMTNLHK